MGCMNNTFQCDCQSHTHCGHLRWTVGEQQIITSWNWTSRPLVVPHDSFEVGSQNRLKLDKISCRDLYDAELLSKTYTSKSQTSTKLE